MKTSTANAHEVRNSAAAMETSPGIRGPYRFLLSGLLRGNQLKNSNRSSRGAQALLAALAGACTTDSHTVFEVTCAPSAQALRGRVCVSACVPADKAFRLGIKESFGQGHFLMNAAGQTRLSDSATGNPHLVPETTANRKLGPAGFNRDLEINAQVGADTSKGSVAESTPGAQHIVFDLPSVADYRPSACSVLREAGPGNREGKRAGRRADDWQRPS
ncbi:hypothetical protein LJ737_11480 [Hymenobacter sp. 15J16-1T3B]|uniref:hypothetical protein n=1 Tax=Hymenobacter sp. 15J16-1T3B TaxID=2886941 RepID=UPI001D0FD74E|nr:hypothetical protein [Hymenobacter sp. 15J16-1T3B]MCC3157861.1 hypothetical protein [Hymenobacter sp. 15J16-1T3B]